MSFVGEQRLKLRLYRPTATLNKPIDMGFFFLAHLAELGEFLSDY